ncbi:MAG: LTA synthase family protein [Ruminococcaceae bacterium]|nr:LTA synthase family protein [Oscillospiraceae bacterium]
MKSSFFQVFQSRLRRIAAWLSAHPPILVLLLSFGIALANEVLSRHSLIDALRFTVTKPFFFLCNTAVILLTISLALLCRKRAYMITFLSLLWLGMGITNCIVRFFRQAPFSAMDFTLVLSVFPILFVYLSWIGVILMALGILALVIILIVRFIKAKKNNPSRTSGILPFFLSLLFTIMSIGGGYLFRVIPTHFSSLITAYHDYGFSFCFVVSALDRGIDKPEDYDEKIDDVLSDLLPETDETQDGDPLPPSDTTDEPLPAKDTPNVIVVQLESFIDLKLLQGFTFSEDPTPIFSSLKEQYQSGFLTVPSIGAGTANTEFEVLSGMSLQWFGAGEYPYETVLQKKTCETICYNLKNHQYTTHAVHNYNGNFYDRNDVFSRLGFDTFTSLEYMNNVTYNPIGWAKDAVLIPYIIDCLTTTEGSDLVYCITVQGHGKYPQEALEDEDEAHLTLEAWPEDANADSFSYFANQLHETDAFIGALISAVNALREDTVIVFFGDHLPNIGIQESWLPDGMTLYNTEYVLWHSEGEASEDKNLTSYQLSAEIMSHLGFEDGILTKLHQQWAHKDTYLDYLEMLEYDLLYGDCLAYGGELPFEATDIVMGIRPITISDVQMIGDNTYVSGQNFTPASRIVLNGLMRQTEFISETTLVLENIAIDSGDVIQIIQVADGLFRLSETEDYIYN